MEHYSIIIPVLNEAENIIPLLDRLQPLVKHPGQQPKVIFVDDGSRDATRQIISSYAGPMDVRLLCRENQRGLAGAVVAGARAATGEVVVVMDGDLSHPPEAIPQLLEQMRTSGCEMVIGSRYVQGGTTEGWPRSRRIASLLASIPARMLTGVKDPLAGYFAVRRDRLAAITGGLDGFKIGLELLMQGLSATEVPIRFVDRAKGASKMTAATLASYLKQLLRLCCQRSILFRLLQALMVLAVPSAIDPLIFSALLNHGSHLDTAHICSFLIAATLYAISSGYTERGRQQTTSRDRLGYITLVLLILGLRGGLLALLHLETAGPPWQLLVPMALVTGLSLSLCRRLGPRIWSQPTDWRFLGWLLIGYSLLLRLIYLGSAELLQEEAYYWNYAQHLAPGYLDHPPLVALLIHAGTLLFGNNEFGVRIGALVCWLVTAFFSFRLAQDIYNLRTAFGVLILVATLPIFFGSGLVVTPDAPLIACWSGAIWYLHQALVRGRAWAWLGCGIMLGFGMASKYTIALLGPAILLFMILDRPSRSWFARPQPYLAVLLALIIFSPVIWWNYQHDWASFLFQSQDRLTAEFTFGTPALLASIIALLGPVGIWSVTAIVASRTTRRLLLSASLEASLPRSYLFALVMVLVPLSVFLVFSLSRGVKLNWTGPLWLALLPFMAWLMLHAGSTIARWRQPGPWPASLTLLVFGYAMVLHYAAIGLPGIPFGERNNLLWGWEDLASQIESRVQSLDDKGGYRPVVAGMDKYRLASGLAFYRSKQSLPASQEPVEETTGRHLFDRGALMYAFWHPPGSLVGRDILVLAEDPDQLSSQHFDGHYRQLGKIGEISVSKRGKKAGRYYYRLLTWYSPSTDASSSLALGNTPKNLRQGKQTAQTNIPATLDRKDTLL